MTRTPYERQERRRGGAADEGFTARQDAGRHSAEPAGRMAVAPALYDPMIGMQCFRDGMEKLEFADYLGFDWISLSEHHYSYDSVAPHPAIMAAAMADRIKRARLAILAHVLPLNNPVRVAEELAMLDYRTGGRLVVGFLRGTVNEDQTFSVNPTETRAVPGERGAHLGGGRRAAGGTCQHHRRLRGPARDVHRQSEGWPHQSVEQGGKKSPPL
jgi:hypothetical protein